MEKQVVVIWGSVFWRVVRHVMYSLLQFNDMAKLYQNREPESIKICYFVPFQKSPYLFEKARA
ncbi:hypothetical protein [Hungatella hathewayi]|uniref:Uncharacterized protein n=1 Tax=Hungatella hathewayi DSM 13479 TaxID=566550 RepID=D3ABR4_9FIRM|nr:hypothetical protein [Hungatella hathewayi]EFD00737.1 hypothetical protein CLOSTHATH_01042 [Hungatella hathewayi DSM 13479]